MDDTIKNILIGLFIVCVVLTLAWFGIGGG